MYGGRRSIKRTSAAFVASVATVVFLLLGSAMRAGAVVDLVYFRATAGDNDILIEWETGDERTTIGFNLHRTETDIFTDATKLNEEGIIDAKNFPNPVGARYTYTDSSVDAGVTYFYWLEVLDTGGPERHGPEPATVGPTPTPTPASTATETPTSTPAQIPTSTPTRMPTATWTPTPIETPAFTPTRMPSATPTSALSATPATAPMSTPSPAMTASGTGEPPTTSVPTTGDVSPSPTPTSQVVGALTDQTESPERSFRLQATSWRPPGVAWPTVSTSTILLFMSVISFLGVLLLATALVLVRKFGF